MMNTRPLIQFIPTLTAALMLSACAPKLIETPKRVDEAITVSHPAAVTELTILSEGARLPGLIYQAAGAGPHPTALFLHGYPGNERSLDVAQAVRQNGWNAVYFNYRGAWGAEGEFSFRHAEADVQNAIQTLSDPDTAQELRIDPHQIALVGHSMGGHMALAGLLDNPKVRCAVSYDGANMGANGTGLFSSEQAKTLWKNYSDTLFMLTGWSGQKALDEISQHGSALDLLPRLATLEERPVLILAADTEVIPMDVHINPLVEAIRAKNPDQVRLKIIPDDHSFSNHRPRIIQETQDFLDQYCRA